MNQSQKRVNYFLTTVLGTLMGSVFLSFGIYALLGGNHLDAYTENRANGFGWAATLGGIWAITASLFVSDLTHIW